MADKCVGVEVALDVAGVGIKVFPLVRGAKFPHGKEQHPDAQKANATTDESIIRAWAERFPGCNWGMILPPTMVLIDVDMAGDGGENPWLNQPGVREELEEAFLAVETPSGGRHYYFAQPDPGRWNGGNGSERTVPHVDVRSGESFYAVAPGCLAEPKPGSGPESGQKPYQIIAGKLVEALDLSAPGPVISEFLDSFHRAGAEPGGRAPVMGVESGTIDLSSLHAFANTCPGWQKYALQLFMEAEGVERHEEGRDRVVRFHRPGSENLWGATWNTPESRHGSSGKVDKALGFPRLYAWSPNWTYISERDGEGRRKGYSAVDLINLLLQDKPNERQEAWRDIEAEYGVLTEAGEEEFGQEQETEGLVQADPSPALKGDELIDAHEAMAREVIGSCRDGGFLRMFWSELERVEYRPQPMFRLAASIVALSGLIGRKVVTPNGEMSSLMVMCIGQTGCGKESARSAAARLLDEVRPGATATAASRMVERCGLPHSGSGLFNVLAQRPARVMVSDEIGALLEAGAKDSNGLQGTLLATMVELFTVGTGIMLPRERADRVVNSPPVRAPFLSMLGFTQPEKLDALVSNSTIELGLVPRMLLFHGRNGVPLRRGMSNINSTEVPRELVQLAQAWQDFTPTGDPDEPGRLTFTAWRFSDEASRLVEMLTNHFENKLMEANRNKSITAACFTRAVQMVKRLSLVFAADRLEAPREDWAVEYSDVYSASLVVNASIENIVNHIDDGMTASDHGRVMKKVTDFLFWQRRQNPEQWFTATAIAKKVRDRLIDNARDRREIFKTLVEDGLIEIRKTNIRGIERLQYRHAI